MMIPLNKLFAVQYGNKLDRNKLTPTTKKQGGINFVGRSGQNHGVRGVVEPLPDTEPYPAGLITVALGGCMLASFVQESEFYTAQNVAVLRPLNPMSFQQKLFVCLAIKQNRFKYSPFGREANRTLRTLEIPSINDFPSWITEYDVFSLDTRKNPKSEREKPIPLNTNKWQPFDYEYLFEIKKGQRLTKANMQTGEVPFIGASDRDNGVTAQISQAPIHDGNTITVSYNGSVGEAFYQPEPFWASDDINVLYPKGFELDKSIALFLCTIIRQEKYRFNYGRKWHKDRMKRSKIWLPVDANGKPDWEYMRSYMDTLPYSSQI